VRKTLLKQIKKQVPISNRYNEKKPPPSKMFSQYYDDNEELEAMFKNENISCDLSDRSIDDDCLKQKSFISTV